MFRGNRSIIVAVGVALIGALVPSLACAARPERITSLNSSEFLKAKKQLQGEKLSCRLPKKSGKKATLGFIRKQNGKKFFFPLSKDERADAKSQGLSAICNSVVASKCKVTAADVSIAVGASNTVPITAFGITSCNRPLALIPQSEPQHGTLNGGTTPTYQVSSLFSGTDTASFKVSNGLTTSQNAATISVTVQEFAGSMSLEPYRESLTEHEVRRILRKVAFGGTEELVNIGVTQGRTALVNALLVDTTSPAAMQAAVAAGQSLRSFAAPAVDACGNSDVWLTAATQRYWHSLMLHGNPLLENIALQLHDHFAIDTQKIQTTSGCASAAFPRMHLETLRDYALGSFSGLLTEMLTDQAMSRWLDNTANHFFGGGYPNNFNQNFAREFLELFTMGKFNHFDSTQRNYEERDVQELTRAFSGYCLSNVNSHRHSRDPVTLRYYRDDAGPYGGASVYACNDYRDTSSKQFLGSGVDDFNLESGADYVIRSPKTAENIAHSFFSRFVAVSPPKEAIVAPLAAQLASNSSEFNMREFMRTILNSSAMFSPEAVRNCIDSPAEHLTFLVRTMKMPAQSTSFLNVFATALMYAGHNLLQAPSVFSWQMCGDDGDGRPGNRGEAWLQQGWLIQRFNAVNNLIAAANQYEAYDPRLMFPNPAAITPDAAINHFEKLFNLTLSAAERARVTQYLDRTTSRWNANDAALVRARLGGLYYIFATHVKVLTK